MTAEKVPLAERGQKPIVETDTHVSYLGVALEKAPNRDHAPRPEDYTDYINDDFSLELQQKIAVSFLQGDPILIEGGTSIGKTTTVKKMCAELGWEVHYANLNGATDVEDLMGRYIPNTQAKEPNDPQYMFADGRVTSGLRQEADKTKVIILDELNSASPNILIRLHEVLDALERGGEVVLAEDASEAVPVNKAKTKIIALMNPPGKGFLQREALDPALLRRWVYQKEVTDLPPKTLAASVNTLFGLTTPESELSAEKYLSGDESAATREILAEIPGMGEIAAKYEEFHRAAKKLVGRRKVAQDQPQPFTYDDREEPRRVRNFVARFYRGDINTTFQDALRYYYQGKLLDPKDKAQLEELIKHVEYTPPETASNRRGLETPAPNRASAAKSLLQNPAVPEDIKQRVAALEERAETAAGETAVEEAESIMGDQFLGPAAIKEALGIEVAEVPPIPFTAEELHRGHALGQQLLLCVDALPDSTPLTMNTMREIVGGKAADGQRLLYKWKGEGEQEWYEKEPFWQEAPAPGWRLVSPEVVPHSTKNNYINQTASLIDYIRDEVYQDIPLPEKYREAIEEFTDQQAEIAALLDADDIRQAGDRMQNLAITSLLRESAPQALYRLIVAEKASGKKSLATRWSWTATRSADGSFVSVGGFVAAGWNVSRDGVGDTDGSLGACLSRG